jgi:hypothetical protein
MRTLPVESDARAGACDRTASAVAALIRTKLFRTIFVICTLVTLTAHGASRTDQCCTPTGPVG